VLPRDIVDVAASVAIAAELAWGGTGVLAARVGRGALRGDCDELDADVLRKTLQGQRAAASTDDGPSITAPCSHQGNGEGVERTFLAESGIGVVDAGLLGSTGGVAAPFDL